MIAPPCGQTVVGVAHLLAQSVKVTPDAPDLDELIAFAATQLPQLVPALSFERTHLQERISLGVQRELAVLAVLRRRRRVDDEVLRLDLVDTSSNVCQFGRGGPQAFFQIAPTQARLHRKAVSRIRRPGRFGVTGLSTFLIRRPGDRDVKPPLFVSPAPNLVGVRSARRARDDSERDSNREVELTEPSQ